MEELSDSTMVIAVRALPASHIFRQIYREYRPGEDGHDARWSDLRRPIDIGAIVRRLRTQEGREEARHWVGTPLFDRLFIHQLCDSNFGARGNGILRVDAESGLVAIRLALEAYPESIRLADSAGYLPLHNVCERSTTLLGGSSTPGSWHRGCKKIFTFLLEKYPGAASAIARSGRSALSFVLDSQYSDSPSTNKDRDDILLTLLDLSPSLAKVPDNDGRLPLHFATHGHAVKANIIKKLIQLYPQAIEKKCYDGFWGGKTPLLSFLRCVFGNLNEGEEKIVSMMLRVSPSSAWVEDSSVLRVGQEIDASGDALDHAAVSYCSNLKGMTFVKLFELADDVTDDDIDCMPCNGGYVAAGEEYLDHCATGGDLYMRGNGMELGNERMFRMILRICRIMDGTTSFRPLHAFCNSRCCRPWYLAIMDQVIKRYPNEAKERDDENHLPIHLFLQSCVMEKERAKRKGYIADDEEYFRAVHLCFKLILDANPDATTEENGDGLLPIHLAIEHCNELKFGDILQPLLEVAPETVHTRHLETGLRPFAQASVGFASNLDTAFTLLRREPSVLETLN